MYGMISNSNNAIILTLIMNAKFPCSVPSYFLLIISHLSDISFHKYIYTILLHVIDSY